MKNMIERVKLFVKEDDFSKSNADIVREKFIKEGFILDDDSFDLAIAIGGDGTFLRMMKECSFDDDVIYVGINSGTLGFLQEVKLEEIDKFLCEIKNGYYKLEDIGIQETVIEHKNGTSKFYSLNEVVIRDVDLKVIKMELKIDGEFLECFSGDGILIATSVGSTAHNLSYGGSIVYDTFSSLQITPMAPLWTRAYRSLPNSIIIPDKKEISLTPLYGIQNLSIIVDGEHSEFEAVRLIKTAIDGKKIRRMRLSHHNFPQKINEKLLTDKNSVIIRDRS